MSYDSHTQARPVVTPALELNPQTDPDFRSFFERTPGAAIVVRADSPTWTIVAATEAYLDVTLTTRAAVVGRGTFEVFPENPETGSASGQHNIRASFERVLASGAPDRLQMQRYDVPLPPESGGGFEERYWNFESFPLSGADGHIVFILHHVADVTERHNANADSVAARKKIEEAHLATEESERRAHFMANATSMLFDSMDYHRTLADLAHVAVPTIGDWCAIDIVEGDGSFRRLAVAHQDPTKVELAKELEERYPEDAESPTSRTNVLRSGIPVFIPEITDQMLDEGARDADHARLIRALGLTSFITAPLIARGHRLGTITIVMAESGRRYTHNDLALVQDLARRAAVAMDNARLYSEVVEGGKQLEAKALQLEEVVSELETANDALHEQAIEMEAAQEAMQQSATELEMQTEELQNANDELAVQRSAAELARRRVTTILESITDAFFALDTEWRFTYVNERAEEILQRAAAELIGKSVLDEFPDLTDSPFERALRDAVETRSSVRAEEYHAQRERWFELAAYPSPDGLSVYLQDVSERHEIQDALGESEARYRFLADAIPVQVWTATPDGALDYVSKGVTDYFARSAEEIQGNGWAAMLHPDDLERTGETWTRALSTGERYEVEFRLWSPTHNDYRWHLARALPLHDGSGAITKWFGSNTDIEDQKRVERERERLQHEAENANRAKMEFLAAMSHELRTPLNAISGYAELMDMGVVGPVTEAQKDYLARVQRSGKFLLGLINDVLNFAKIDAGAVEIKRVPVRLDTILSAAHTLVEPQMRTKNLTYKYEGGTCTAVVLGDTEKIEQVILNLLSNAAKFTDEGGQISLACTHGDGFARIVVADTGRGIAADKLDSIFDPFVQVDRNANLASQQGVGLGLAISRELARRMGGDLTADSTVGDGSRFTLSLPLVG